MLAAAVDAVWSGARGWLTPPVLFVLINLVIGTIAVMSRLMSAPPGDGRSQRSLMRAPSVAFDRLRCFSFSRLGLPAFDDGAASAEPASPIDAAPEDGGEWRRMSLLRAPSVAFDRLRGLSFSRRSPADSDGATDAEPSRPAPAEEPGMMELEQAGIERSQSEAAVEAPARRRRRARKKSGREERADDGMAAEATAGTGVGEAAGAGRHPHELPAAVEVDARADDFIRQFREELRLQRLDSILRYNDTLRRTGTV